MNGQYLRVEHGGGEEERLGRRVERLVLQELESHAPGRLPQPLGTTAHYVSVAPSPPTCNDVTHLGVCEREQELVGFPLTIGPLLSTAGHTTASVSTAS